MGDENLRYEIATPECHDKMLQFLLDYFRVQEPTNAALEMQEEDIRGVFDVICRLSLRDPISFVVYDTCNQIVACRLSSFMKSEDKTAFDGIKPNDKSLKVLNFLDALDALLPGYLQRNNIKPFEKPFKFQILSVRTDYYRQGIGEKLINMSIKKAREVHSDVILVTATAFKSQRLFDKLGFETVGSLEHSKYVDDKGTIILSPKDNTTVGAMLIKRL